MTIETRTKIAASMKGMKKSDEHRKHMSEAAKKRRKKDVGALIKYVNAILESK